MRAESERSAGMAACSSSTPTLYMSKRSGLLSCHRIGESAAATGGGGARGVCTAHKQMLMPQENLADQVSIDFALYCSPTQERRCMLISPSSSFESRKNSEGLMLSNVT